MEYARRAAAVIALPAAAAAFAIAIGCSSGSGLKEGAVRTAPEGPPGPAPPGMVWIPGGEFSMGSDSAASAAAERPVHRVYVDGFFMDVHTVTNARFSEFVLATGYVTVAERAPDAAELLRQAPPGTPHPDPAMLVPGSLVFTPTTQSVNLQDWSQWWRWVPGADWRHPDGPESSTRGREQHPVVHVAWPDAAAFAEWAGGRLPSEAEWEFAARGGIANAEHAWGDHPFDPEDPQARIYEGVFPTHAAAPKPVGSYAANGYGLYDMSGNVWQWTLDWYRPDTYERDHRRGVAVNPTGPPQGMERRDGFIAARVLRGGSFLCSDSYCRGYRISARSPGDPQSGASHIGFRTVMTAARWKETQNAR